MEWSIWNNKITCGSNNQTLRVNQACLNVLSHAEIVLKFYVRNRECLECDYALQKYLVYPNVTTSFIMDTKYGFESYFLNGGNTFCEISDHFEDFGVYSLSISKDKICKSIEIVKEPEKFWLNFTLLLCFYLGAWALYGLFKLIYSRSQSYFESPRMPLRELETDLGRLDCESDSTRMRKLNKFRLMCLDAYRGLVILIMIFVNYSGGSYAVFEHAPWNGLTIADLVFPWFVWIMGASITLSLTSKLRTSASRKFIFFQILKRSLILISLGLILNSGHHEKNSLRLCGVLQRLGITYFIVASMEMLILKSHRNELVGSFSYWRVIIDFCSQWFIAGCFTLVHLLITFMLKVPGCPTGYLGPGGLSQHSMYKNCTGGAAGYIDRLVITDKHMYHRGSFVNIFKPSVPYDPEGLLGTLTCVLSAFFGVHAAKILFTHENSYSRIKRWLIYALITGITAGFLCNWSKNNGVIPVNKNLWSLSYVLASSSMAYLILSLFYWLIDHMKIWSGFPLLYPGMNSITLYLGHSLLKNQLPWKWVPFTNTHFELLLMDASAATVWLAVSYFLFKYKVFITL